MTKSAAEDPFWGVAQIAKVFDVKPLTVRRWLRDEQMKGVHINGHWKVRRSEVDRYIEELYGE